MKPQRHATAEKRLMGEDPLAPRTNVEAILEQFYKPASELVEPAVKPASKADKPTHYKVVCISLYNEDIANLEAMVAELKRRGHTKANKSQLIRAALAQVDLGKIPKGF